MEIKLKLNKMNEVNNILPLVNNTVWYTKKHFKMISLMLTALTIHTHTQVHKETFGGDRYVYYFDFHDAMVVYENCIH